MLGHPADCPSWDYENYSDHSTQVPLRTKSLLAQMRRGQVSGLSSAADSRPQHKYLFDGLVPPQHEYFAGNYRGSKHRCLEFYEVCVQGDDRVGHPSGGVAWVMEELGSTASDSLAVLDDSFQRVDEHFSKPEKTFFAVAVACRLFEEFLRIHPYANGNGHIARWLIWCILGRYNLWPHRWPVHERPPGPYAQLIIDHRNGKKHALEQFVLRCLSPPDSASS